jgi:AcrR family transcriptional regulator
MAATHAPGTRSATGRGDAQRQAFLDAAVTILGREGYGALSVASVCKLAGAAPPSLYWHFGNKGGLLAAMVKYIARRDADAFIQVDVRELGWREAVDTYLKVLRRLVVSEQPNNWLVLAALVEARDAAPEVRDLIAEARRHQIEFNAEMIGRLWDIRERALFCHLWLANANYVSLLYRDTGDAALVDDALRSFKRTFFLAAAALAEAPARDPGMRETLAEVGFVPAGVSAPPAPRSSARTRRQR